MFIAIGTSYKTFCKKQGQAIYTQQIQQEPPEQHFDNLIVLGLEFKQIIHPCISFVCSKV